MRTSLFISAALALTALTAVTTAPASAKDKPAAAPAEKINEKLIPLLVAAQEANGKKDYATALSKLEGADALAASPYEKFVTSQMRAIAAQGTKNTPLLLKNVEAAADSGYTGVGVSVMAINAGQLEYEAKDYVKAIQHLQQAQQLGNADPQIPLMIGDAYIRSKQTATALTFFEKMYNDDIAAKRTTSLGAMELIAQAALDANMVPDAIKWLSRRAAAYPTVATWHDLLSIYHDRHPQLNAQSQLDLYRLMKATKSFKLSGEINEYAEIALEKRGLPGEAKAAYDYGSAAGVITKMTLSMTENKALATTRATKEHDALPTYEKQSAAAPNGRVARGTADTAFSFDQYAKAIELYKLAASKGGVEPRVTSMGIGESYALLGDKVNAHAALAAVTGESADIAGFWLTWVDQVK